MILSERLKTLRTMRGLTQEELGKRAGIPVNYISHMETGKVIPAGEWDARIREALDWTPEVDAKLDALNEVNA